MSDALLRLNDISIAYGNKFIVNNISFDVRAGEMCALLGLNGSGKTTLLKGICGLLHPSGGRCYVNGIDISMLNEKERAKCISYIPQRHSKLIGVTVIDAVLMGLNASLGVLEFPSVDNKMFALYALERMNIPHLAHEDFSRLSEGQKQLVILARTLVQNAPVMLMDEPDSALDFHNKHMILSEIHKLTYTEKKACLVTLHDPNPALAYCDRLILLNNGIIASELILSNASIDDVQNCLSVVYNRINVFKYDGVFCCSYNFTN